ncbi:MAG: heme exporter protein CcmD, partial [Alterinioella nitratireducens]|uniref:heme exporter protein CcmD n=2 Tax=Alterinioella nitratireducens TaxID=2735915 RepID=UPI00405971AC
EDRDPRPPPASAGATREDGMMPDLGAYRVEVLSAYAGTLLLLAVLVATSIWKARRTLRQLRDAEARRESVK